MRIPRSATFALVSLSTSISAFSPAYTASSRCSFVTRASNSFSQATARSSPLASSTRSLLVNNNMSRKSLSRSLGLNMILDKLFGGGGSYGQKINYDNLDHPGPELAKAAQEGKVPATSDRDPNLQLATFAGGCFWGLELAYQRVPGVVYTAAGYTQGNVEEPNYDQVCSGSTGHTEAVVVYYDPRECSYETLLDTFFKRVDPTTVNGQGNDYGTQYRTGVYYHTPEQEKIAKERFEQEQGNYRKPIASECKAATPFWPAEKYHQQYLEKGGRFGMPQSAEKGATDTIRCYG